MAIVTLYNHKKSSNFFSVENIHTDKAAADNHTCYFTLPESMHTYTTHYLFFFHFFSFLIEPVPV